MSTPLLEVRREVLAERFAFVHRARLSGPISSLLLAEGSTSSLILLRRTRFLGALKSDIDLPSPVTPTTDCQSFGNYYEGLTLWQNYVWANMYDENHPSNVLGNGDDVTTILYGSGQEDEVVESAVTANHAGGQNITGCREKAGLRVVVTVAEFEGYASAVRGFKVFGKQCIED